MVYNINWFMDTCKSETRYWALTLGVLIAVGMFSYAVSAPIISIRPASHIHLKITQRFVTHFKTIKKVKFN